MTRVTLAVVVLGLTACGSSGAPVSNGTSGAGGGGLGGDSGAAGQLPASGNGGASGAGPGSGGNPGAGAAWGGGAAGGAGGSGGLAPVEKLADCALEFPYREQAPRGFWLGADSNFSVALSPTRALMTFQDSFVGGEAATSRSGSTMVGSSVASITCSRGQYAIEYHWGGGESEHRALFDEGRADERLWVHRPWVHQGKLLLTATRVTSDDQGFHEHGITLARANDPLAAPESWQIEYFDLTDQRLTVGKGIFETDDHVYLFTPHENDMLLARLARAKMLEASISESSLEYLKSDGTWAAGLAPESARRLGIAANTGLTVRYHQASSRFLAVFTDTRGWPSASIAVSSAPALEGPWSTPQELYSVPEMKPGSPGFDAETICYGAAEQLSFNPRPDEDALLTYTCNSLSFSKLLSNLDIYVPRVVTVPMPALP